MKKCESVIDQTNDNLFPKYEPDQQELKLYNKECSRKKKTLMSIFDDEGRVDTYELFMLINEYSQASIERMLSSFIKNVERNALPVPNLYAKWFWSPIDGDNGEETDGASNRTSSPDMYSFRLEAGTRGASGSGRAALRPVNLKKAREELLPLIDSNPDFSAPNIDNSVNGGNMDNGNDDSDDEQPASPRRRRPKGNMSIRNNIAADLEHEVEDTDADEEGSVPVKRVLKKGRTSRILADAAVESLRKATSILNEASVRNDPLEEAVTASKQVISIATSAATATSSGPRRSTRQTGVPVTEMTDEERYKVWSEHMIAKWKISEPKLQKSVFTTRAKDVWKKMSYNDRYNSANAVVREVYKMNKEAEGPAKKKAKRGPATKKVAEEKEVEKENEKISTPSLAIPSSGSSSSSSSASAAPPRRSARGLTQEDETVKEKAVMKVTKKSLIKGSKDIEKNNNNVAVLDTGRPSRTKRPVNKFNPVLPAGSKKYEEAEQYDMTLYAQQINAPNSQQLDLPIHTKASRKSASITSATSSSDSAALLATAPAIRPPSPRKAAASAKERNKHLKYLDADESESSSDGDDDSEFEDEIAPTQPQIAQRRTSSNKKNNNNNNNDDDPDRASTEKKTLELAHTRKALFQRKNRGEKLNFSDDDDDNDDENEDSNHMTISRHGEAVNSLLQMKNTTRRIRATSPRRVNLNIQSSLGQASSSSTSSRRRGGVSKQQQRRKWTDSAINNFIRAIRDHGAGNWLAIREDRRYNSEYQDRTTVQLKDKYRTLLQQGHL